MAKMIGAAAHLLKDLAGFEAEFRQPESCTVLVRPALQQGIVLVDTSLLDKNPFQARQVIQDSEVEEIAKSLLAVLDNGEPMGLLQPITVRPHPESEGRYQIVSGEKRWRAAEMVAVETVPVIIKDYSDRDMMIVGLVENVKRSDLSAVDLARSALRLKQAFQFSNVEVAELLNLGKSKSAYSMTVKILALPESVLDFMNDNQQLFTAKHGRVLLEQNIQESRMLNLACKVVEHGWSARELEKHCQQTVHKGHAPDKSAGFTLSAGQRQTLDYLQQVFERPVRHLHRAGKHTLVLECEDNTALNEMLNRFTALAQRAG